MKEVIRKLIPLAEIGASQYVETPAVIAEAKELINSQNIGEEIIYLLREKAHRAEYCNPHFAHKLTELIWSYYSVEDEDVDNWIEDTIS